MKFGIDSVEKIVSHWLLQDLDTAKKVSETLTKGTNLRSHSLEAKVTVNGVELPFGAFESYMMSVYEGEVSRAREEFKDLDAEVQRRLEKRLKEEAQPILDKMWELQRSLEDAGSVLKPYWEK